MAISKEEEAVWRECGASDTPVALGASDSILSLIADAGGMQAFAASPAKALDYQDILDHLLTERLIQVRNALRGLGWAGAHSQPSLHKTIPGVGNCAIVFDLRHAGAGHNVVGVRWGTDASGVQPRCDYHDDTMTQPAADMAKSLNATLLAMAPINLATLIPLSDGPYGKGFRDALDSVQLALNGVLGMSAIAAVLRTSLEAYGNHADRQDDLLDAATEVVDSFPGFETDEDMSGADVVDRLAELYPRLADAVREYRPHGPIADTGSPQPAIRVLLDVVDQIEAIGIESWQGAEGLDLAEARATLARHGCPVLLQDGGDSSPTSTAAKADLFSARS